MCRLGRPWRRRNAIIGAIEYPIATSMTSPIAQALPPPRCGQASTKTPVSPTSSPAQRSGPSRSASPASRARTTLTIGTAAISSPVMELVSSVSACDSSAQGPRISIAVNASSGRQCRRTASAAPP